MVEFMVTLKYLELEGFRGVMEPLRVDFSPSFTVITGRNGSGKSTICDAIEYALTRRITKYVLGTEKGQTIADYVWWVGEKVPKRRRVALGLQDDAGRLIIISQTPEGSQLEGAESLENLLCSADAPVSAIEQLCRTTIIRDEMISAHSLDLSEADKYAFVRSALGSDFLKQFETHQSDVEAFLRKRKRMLDSEYKERRGEVVFLESQLSELKSEMKPEDTVSKAEQEIRLQLGQSGGSLETLLEHSLLFVRNRRAQLAEIENLRQRVLEFHKLSSVHSNFQEELGSLNAQRSQLMADVEGLNATVMGLRDKLDDGPSRLEDDFAALLNHGRRIGLRHEACPLCRKEQTPAEFEKALNQLSEEVEHLAEGRLELRERLKRAEADIAKATDNLLSIDGRIANLSEHQKRLVTEAAPILGSLMKVGMEYSEVPSVNAIEEIHSSLLKEVQDFETRFYTLQTSNLVEQITAIESKLRMSQEQSDSTEKRLRSTITAISNLIDLRKGIHRAIGEVVQERLASLEPLLKDLYRRLQPHADWTEIGLKLRGDVRRFLSLEVGDGLNPGFIFSSGQRRGLGLVFLLSVHLSRPWSRLNTLVMDDAVQHIDDYRALHLAEVLSAIRKNKQQILCTVEDEALAALLCRRLRPEPNEPGLLVRMKYQPGQGVSRESQRTIDALREEVLLSA